MHLQSALFPECQARLCVALSLKTLALTSCQHTKSLVPLSSLGHSSKVSRSY